MMDSDDRLAHKYQAVFQILAEEYGEPAWRQHLPPVDELVSTILSQSTSDVNRDKGFYALKERYADWESVMEAPEEEIIETIRSAGLANQKGPRIQAALRHIKREQGQISLDFLDKLSLEEANNWLVAIKGIGPKTAAIILLFAFGRPAFPVDTHVHRITKRLGLISPKVTADKAHKILQNMGDAATFYPFHLNLIRHGREVCRSRKPQCDICPLQPHCDSVQRSLDG
jgi:endonuclease-3